MVETQRSDSARARGVKKFLLSRGVRMDEMQEYLVTYFTTYGHQDEGRKTLRELLVKAGKFFPSLRVYTDRIKPKVKKGKETQW